LSLEKQIKEKEKDYLFVVEEMGDLTRRINDLEAEVEHKSNVMLLFGNRSVSHVVLLMPFELLLGNRSVPHVVLLLTKRSQRKSRK
jgi:hypothetical protein